MAEATTDPVRLPPGPRIPKFVLGLAFLTARHRAVAAVGRRYSGAFTVDLPIFGQTVVIGDRALIKDLFTTSGDLVGRASNLGTVLGPGSTFSLDGDEHRERRKLLVPPFHGKRMAGYEAIVEEEVMRETDTWPEGREFETLQPMMRITLNAILRTVFGAQGNAFDELRQLLPPMVPLASRIAVMPPVVRRDLGPWSPWGRVQRYRRRYDEIIASLISEARADPAFEDRNDVLALMLQARYEDGSPISDRPRRRRVAHAARGRPRDDRDDPGMDDRAAAPPSAAVVKADGGSRRGRIRTVPGHDLGGAAHPSGRRGHRADGA